VTCRSVGPSTLSDVATPERCTPIREATAQEIAQLCHVIEIHDGEAPLSDATETRLSEHSADSLALLYRDAQGQLTACSVHIPADNCEFIEYAIRPDMRSTAMSTTVLEAALAHRQQRTVRVRRPLATADDDAIATQLGLHVQRTIHELRRALHDLPEASLPNGVVVRSFVPGRDNARWLEANTRAFATHPEQGSFDAHDLDARMRAPWFDAAGFLIAGRGDDIVAFCWTKLHHQQRIGEIYVIGVDPKAQRQGLGSALVIAGLHAIAKQGIEQAMLYVEAGNEAAHAMYAQLGFTHHSSTRIYGTTVSAQ
jgi:mycothiol synthase